MEPEIMTNLLTSVLAGIISAMISLFVEYRTGIRGKTNPNMAAEPNSGNAEPKKDIPQSADLSRKRMHRVVKNIIRLPLILGAIVAIVTFSIGYWSGWSSNRIIKLEVPKIIEELAIISDATILTAKLNEYSERGVIAVGQRSDFENPDEIFVFVLDEERVYRVFLFRNQNFYDLRTSTQFIDLPKQFKSKQKIWVIESDSLVRPNY